MKLLNYAVALAMLAGLALSQIAATPGSYSASCSIWGEISGGTTGGGATAEVDNSGTMSVSRWISTSTPPYFGYYEYTSVPWQMSGRAQSSASGPLVDVVLHRSIGAFPAGDGWQRPSLPGTLVRATASANYNFVVNYVGSGTPTASHVPVKIEYAGSYGFENMMSAMGRLDVWQGSVPLLGAVATPLGEYRTATIYIVPNVMCRVMLYAQADASVTFGVSGDIHAVMDPVFSVDPTFASAADYSISISPEVVQTVTSSNTAPIADAGVDQSVGEGALVTLDGTLSSDGESNPLTFTWSQVGGPAVSLSSTTAAQPSFIAPSTGPGGETLSFQLVVNDGSLSSAADVVQIRVGNINRLPVADAGPAQEVRELSAVALDGSLSYDEDYEPLTYQWAQVFGTTVALSSNTAAQPIFGSPSVGPGGELLRFALVVSDGIAISAPSYVDILVTNINGAPIANAGLSQTVDEGTGATLDGSGSSDPDEDAITYCWTQEAGQSVVLSDPGSPTPSFTAPSVEATVDLVFKLVVTDALGAESGQASFTTVTVRDVNSPPSCVSARPSVAELWPPNHKLVEVSILGVTDPDDNGIQITITGVWQDEPTEGTGDGDTACDAVLQGSKVLLRAERTGNGNGRVYHVSYTATDGQDQCSGVVRVEVRRSRAQAAVDGGALHDATQ